MPLKDYYKMFEEQLNKFYEQNPRYVKITRRQLPKIYVDSYLVYSLTNYCKRVN